MKGILLPAAALAAIFAVPGARADVMVGLAGPMTGPLPPSASNCRRELNRRQQISTLLGRSMARTSRSSLAMRLRCSSNGM